MGEIDYEKELRELAAVAMPDTQQLTRAWRGITPLLDTVAALRRVLAAAVKEREEATATILRLVAVGEVGEQEAQELARRLKTERTAHECTENMLVKVRDEAVAAMRERDAALAQRDALRRAVEALKEGIAAAVKEREEVRAELARTTDERDSFRRWGEEQYAAYVRADHWRAVLETKRDAALVGVEEAARSAAECADTLAEVRAQWDALRRAVEERDKLLERWLEQSARTTERELCDACSPGPTFYTLLFGLDEDTRAALAAEVG